MQDICVLYDIASLGMVRISGGHRTGVARAAEDLARALGSLEGCSPILMGSDFQGAAADVAHERLPGLPFIHPRWQTDVSRPLYRFYPNHFMTNAALDHHRLARAGRFGIRAALGLVRPFLRKLPAQTLRDCDVYHAASGVIPRQIAQLGRGKRQLPLFVTVHDLIAIKHPEFFANARIGNPEELLAGLSREYWYLCSSEHTRADLLETGRCDPARVFVTPLAASEDFYPRPECGAAIRARYALGDDPFLLSVCTLEPRKNLDAVIRAFSRLIQEEGAHLPPGLKLVLVGAQGWKYQQVNQAYQQAGAACDRIIFTGYAPEEDLPALYSQALAFVYVSLYEGFGLPVLEAMSCGLPVIASNVSSLPEVVGDAGILQDPRDEEALTHNMLTLCNDPALRTRLSRQAIGRAAAFSWERCAKITLAAYREAVATRRQPRELR